MNPADPPILFSCHDRLGRVSFAKSLARKIDRLTDLDSGFVIGLDGEWGSGKTSVINMVVQALRHLQMEESSPRKLHHGEVPVALSHDELDALAPVYFKVAPEFDDSNSDFSYVSLDQFNRSVARRLATPPMKPEALYRYFRLDLARKKAPRNLVVNFSPWLIPGASSLSATFISDLARAVDGILGEDVASAFKAYAARISELAPIAGAFADLGSSGVGNIFRAGGNWLKNYADESKSLDDLKGALEKRLKTIAPTKIVVVVDDLDRLTPGEAAQMVSLVKGLGRLPNVVYLLGYHLDVLAQHLEKAYQGKPGDGSLYLEKIVQYQRRLPMLAVNSLVSLLEPVIEDSLKNADENTRKRFGDAWRNFAAHHIKTPRDVVRIGNAFKIAHADVGEFTDPADLFILEVLLAKDASLYNWIRQNLSSLCGEDFEFAGADGRRKLREVIEKQGYEKDDLGTRALALLFPRVAEAFQTYGSTNEDSRSRAQKRLHLLEFSRAYFDIAPPLGAWEKSFMSEIIAADNPDEAIATILKRAETAGQFQASLRAQFLEELVAEFGDGRPIPLSWFQALVRYSKTFAQFKDEERSFISRRDNYQRLTNAIFRGLDATDEQARANLILSTLEEAEDISVLCRIVRTAIGDQNSNQGIRERLSFAGNEDLVRNRLIGVIKRLADTGAIWKQVNPSDVIWFWKGSSQADAVSQYLNDEARTDDSFPHIVDLLVGTVISSAEGEYEHVPEWTDKLMDVAAFTKEAERHASDANDPHFAQAKRFLAAYDRGKNDRYG
ncbi:KAP family P-loop NTPase fold protein [Ensifer aridi]|uniref:KAP family P-loop NTPase fold protein n=1 Tax=Ensifer aridi TaxID=1708715 RepID=UPI000A122460|nr:P-loop NTPase fold protein [Ensifer aridi]